ncbi:hypothetical protein TREES_T100010475 [Tupaia chinensis]|uniref:Uncharacterized protein n=1 Tax=Tupaia chinensis TaxID=246437 RepID=L9LAU0_TUPCH|nr:hypothetical protein TREES_T100010475 [Tupaia chinensis]
MHKTDLETEDVGQGRVSTPSMKRSVRARVPGAHAGTKETTRTSELGGVVSTAQRLVSTRGRMPCFPGNVAELVPQTPASGASEGSQDRSLGPGSTQPLPEAHGLSTSLPSCL